MKLRKKTPPEKIGMSVAAAVPKKQKYRHHQQSQSIVLLEQIENKLYMFFFLINSLFYLNILIYRERLDDCIMYIC